MRTVRPGRPLAALALLPLVLLACGAAPDAPAPGSDESSATTIASPLPAPLRARALAHVAEAHAAGVAPEWDGAALGEARAIHRPDVDGPAYYEVAITRGGAPAGYVVLATGAHDYPIVQWNSRGDRPTEPLRARAEREGKRVARYYRLDVGYVAETAGGDLAASDATHAGSLADWRATKAGFADASRDYLGALRAAASAAWSAPAIKTTFGTATGNATSCQVNDWNVAPHYSQLSPHEAPSGRWYSSGCGATAWALMIGWADMQADEGDPKWASYTGLYRQEGSTSTSDPDARAPMAFDWGAKVMTDAISSTLGTWGAPSSDEGVTEPWRMSRITDYLRADGMNGSIIATTFDWGGGEFDSLRDRAIQHICSDKSAAVVGIGALSHYALATAYYVANGNYTFYLDMGHGGGDDGWYSPGIFFAGTLTPQFAGPETRSPRGMEISSATYGGNCPNPQWDNAAVSVANVCDDTSQCSYPIDWHVLGDPAYGCAKTFDVTYRCSATDIERRASVSAEASGKSVALSCPTIGVVSATYGGNCHAPAGNETYWSRAVCNGRTACDLEIDYRVIGDPAPGCAKDFTLQYQCAGGGVKTASAAPEAGFGSVVRLRCP